MVQTHQMKEMPAAADSQSHEALCNVQLSLKVCFDSEAGGTAWLWDFMNE